LDFLLLLDLGVGGHDCCLVSFGSRSFYKLRVSGQELGLSTSLLTFGCRLPLPNLVASSWYVGVFFGGGSAR
jgi:hypothetical protein